MERPVPEVGICSACGGLILPRGYTLELGEKKERRYEWIVNLRTVCAIVILTFENLLFEGICHFESFFDLQE